MFAHPPCAKVMERRLGHFDGQHDGLANRQRRQVAITAELTTRNGAKQREMTCGYGRAVDGINTLGRQSWRLPIALLPLYDLPGRGDVLGVAAG
jgi:hypothetical protein